MHTHILASLGILALALFGAGHAHATVLMAETREGKVVKVELESWGTVGTFGKGSVTITGKDGKKVFHEEFTSAAQFAEGIHNGKALVVFKALGEKCDVSLSFVGTNRALDTHAALEKLLKDPNRRKDPGNSLVIEIAGSPKTYSFKDIVCLLERDP